MFDDLSDLRLFDRILSNGSLSAAARELDLSLAVVSKRLARLEAKTGVRLLQRTTRRLFATEEGLLFQERARRILAEVSDAETLMQGRRHEVHGSLRISAPFGFGRRHLAPLIAIFRKQYPDVNIHLELSDQLIDLLQREVDVAIRYAQPADSRLVSRGLAPSHRVLCASPEYLDWHGEPGTPSDLHRHACILIGEHPQTHWTFGDGEAAARIRVSGALHCNDGDAGHMLALHGAGIVQKSIWDVAADLRANRLRAVLTDFPLAPAPLHVLYPASRHQVPRVRRFVEFLREQLGAVWNRDIEPVANKTG